MPIIIVKDLITLEELKRIVEEQFGEFVKAVVDVEKEIMAVGCELHADGEALFKKNKNIVVKLVSQ